MEFLTKFIKDSISDRKPSKKFFVSRLIGLILGAGASLLGHEAIEKVNEIVGWGLMSVGLITATMSVVSANVRIHSWNVDNDVD